MNIQKMNTILTMVVTIILLGTLFLCVGLSTQVTELQQKVQTLETSQSDFEDEVIATFEAVHFALEEMQKLDEQMVDVIINGN